jgi:hypothetical protein
VRKMARPERFELKAVVSEARSGERESPAEIPSVAQGSISVAVARKFLGRG